jgi:hypothetical protein
MLVGVCREKWRVSVCRPNRSDITDIFVRRPIFRMSNGLTNTALALPPFTASAEGQYRRKRCPCKKKHLSFKRIDFDGDFLNCMLTQSMNLIRMTIKPNNSNPTHFYYHKYRPTLSSMDIYYYLTWQVS